MATITQAQADSMQEQIDLYEQQRAQFAQTIIDYETGMSAMTDQEQLFASKRDALTALLGDAAIEG